MSKQINEQLRNSLLSKLKKTETKKEPKKQEPKEPETKKEPKKTETKKEPKPIINATLFVPSVIAQSYFQDKNGKRVDLKESEINLFYYLMFLCRKEITGKNKNLFIKKGNREIINDKIKYDSVVDIEFLEFSDYGVVQGYDDIKPFIKKLSTLWIKLNIFHKHKEIDDGPINVIADYEIDGTLLTVKFTKKFLDLFLHVDEYFMEVNIGILLSLRGKYTKLLYLLLKDYSTLGRNKSVKFGSKMFRGDELEVIFNNVIKTNLKAELKKSIKKLNKQTDIMVTCP
ncbi:MAG: RepB family plasmid replication initiator protein [SAR324 cluster bacterium]|nr:RepB family plasmid replication initiator protein [SAR324 cluster bacterium]